MLIIELFHYLIHACSACSALPLHRLSLVLHGDFFGILHLFLRFALYAISCFRHFNTFLSFLIVINIKTCVVYQK